MSTVSVKQFCLIRLGVTDYQAAWDLQKDLARTCQSGDLPGALVLLEHPPTYTLGRGADRRNVLVDELSLARLGVKVYHIDRGGDVTFHGPGQLVGYPILSLPRWGLDVHRYLRSLEEVLIAVVGDFGLAARQIPGLTGVWVGEEKIAAIGIKVSHGVTTHGFALNVNPDLSYFQHIFPCGIRDKGVTSLSKLLGRPVDLGEVAKLVAQRFGEEFGAEIA